MIKKWLVSIGLFLLTLLSPTTGLLSGSFSQSHNVLVGYHCDGDHWWHHHHDGDHHEGGHHGEHHH